MRCSFVLLVALVLHLSPALSFASQGPSSFSPAAFVRTLLGAPEGSMDFSRAKLAIDKFIDPSIDVEASLLEIDRMVATVNRMLATIPPDAASTSVERLKALRAFIYDGGWWNERKPFTYDSSDPFGQNIATQLLPNYLASRRGNCVSMPVLFLILGERLGLSLTLSTAPLHVFVKWTDDASGETYNLETTSGAGFTRDAWYRQNLPMTDEAIVNGVYMKTLAPREALAVLATTILDHLLLAKRYDDAIDVADVLLEAYPAHAYALAKKGTAYYRLLEEWFIQKYASVSDIPADEVAHANELYRANQEAFGKAEALGWRMPELN